MSDSTIDLKDEFGNVVSLVVRREGLRTKRFAGKCAHRKMVVDPEFSKLECKECGKEINPVEWLASTAEFYRALQDERRRHIIAKEHYEAKSKCKCEHCGKLTKIRPATDAEVRKFKAKTA